jgi:hypothetical protein
MKFPKGEFMTHILASPCEHLSKCGTKWKLHHKTLEKKFNLSQGHIIKKSLSIANGEAFWKMKF